MPSLFPIDQSSWTGWRSKWRRWNITPISSWRFVNCSSPTCESRSSAATWPSKDGSDRGKRKGDHQEKRLVLVVRINTCWCIEAHLRRTRRLHYFLDRIGGFRSRLGRRHSREERRSQSCVLLHCSRRCANERSHLGSHSAPDWIVNKTQSDVHWSSVCLEEIPLNLLDQYCPCLIK